MSDVVALVQDVLAAEESLLRAAVSEPDDDTYLSARRVASSFYAGPPGSPPVGPRSARAAVPGGTSPEATGTPGADVGAVLYGAARLADAAGWVAFTSDGHDRDGISLGLALLVQEVDGALKVTGRADWDPFVDGIVWAGAGGLEVPVDGPFGQTRSDRSPSIARHAAWLSERLGR